MKTNTGSRFPVPASLLDLERAPYHLHPYPESFDDDDETSRADSFAGLVALLEQSNRSLVGSAAGMNLFLTITDENDAGNVEEDEEPWLDRERIQALYTLVRKSTSLAPLTRQGLVQALTNAVHSLSIILSEYTFVTSTNNGSVPQAFRDAWACHLYMLYSFMFLFEAHVKGSSGTTSGNGAQQQQDGVPDQILRIRQTCTECMLQAAQSMAQHRNKLWQRGVPDEAVVILPLKIAYPLLESATGVLARRAACADAALHMIAVTLPQSTDSIWTSVTAALMDLMHSFEHMAALVTELCILVSGDRLTVELLREYGRLDGRADQTKAVGIRNVAPWVAMLAQQRPRLVLVQLPSLLHHLEHAEAYNLRSAVVTAISFVLQDLAQQQQQNQPQQRVRREYDSMGSESPASLPPGDDAPATALVDTSKTQATLLDVLLKQVYDVSSYTRAAVLKAWIHLVLTGSLPATRFLQVTRLAMDRLKDKTVVARKQAMQLLTILLESNPFMGSLDPSPYREKLAELYDYVKQNLPEHIRVAYETALQEADPETPATELEQATLAAAIAEADIIYDDSQGTSSDQQLEYCKKVHALKFTQSALDFIDVFEDATSALESMLLSANASDVTEALRFFVKARHFQLPCAVSGMKRALSLMWSSEPNIRQEVLQAFREVFLAQPGTEGEIMLPDNQIAKNLMLLVSEATVSELASIEEAICKLVKDERVPANVFSILWSIASKGTGDARTAAIQLLTMGAAADKSVLDSKSRLKLLLDAAFGDYTRENKDWRLARAAAVALQKIERAQVDPTDAKYLLLERIIEELGVIASGEWCVDETQQDTLQWFSVSEQSIKAIFAISTAPELVCRNIILAMQNATFVSEATQCHSLRLARFFHVLGHIALNLLVYTETLSSSVRRGNAKKSLKHQEAVDKARAKKKTTTGANEEVEDAIEAELGIAAEAEAENERKVAEISETEILGKGLISVFGPLLVRVVANEEKTSRCEILSQAATLALCKFMCVSRVFCENHLPLLFTTLANAPQQDTTLRANTVVALGDMAFRFPNEVEPYTPRLYACLRDPNIKVRRHTLMVLTHLILNDMVKVKGQVSEIALCLTDTDQRVRDMSRLLFHELSKRSNNPVYNLLPDIISQLGQSLIPKEDFRSIMSFLLGFIKREKQNEMLTEKLCQRFPKCSSTSQKGDLAFCIAQLKINERCIKSLSDNFKLYKDSLVDDDVKKSFGSIVTRAKKFMKPEMRQLLEEWEGKMQESADLGAEDQVAGEKASKAKARASRRAEKKKQTKKNPAVILEEEEFTDIENRRECSATQDKLSDFVDNETGFDEEFEFQPMSPLVEKENGTMSKAKKRSVRKATPRGKASRV